MWNIMLLYKLSQNKNLFVSTYQYDITGTYSIYMKKSILPA